ncbi:hypothetical protein NLF63_018270 [Clostridioides difficile]|nr:hypothetical protein [Clostridioides difficile]MCL6902714.1 hypothetical protein [Clostridioides difficile]MCR1645738.1 hypothetical protein [Clostridioides difficile]MDE3494042.1 hypothetical protein [Clostridioides difficile]MDE3708412.1 hypothetical protein [Clostridioides difficile]
MKEIKYNVVYFDLKTLKFSEKSFDTLKDARAFKKEKEKKYENVEIIKKTIIEKLII